MGVVSHGILKLTLSEESTNGINRFFACLYRFTKRRMTNRDFLGEHGQTWV